MDQTTEAAAIEEIALRAQSEANAGIDESGLPYVILSDRHRVQDVEALLMAPQRIKKERVFIALASFCVYVDHFKNASTMVNVHRGGNATAIIDASDKDDPQWEQHLAKFNVTYSDRWSLWDGRNKSSMTQRQFAEFVEDNTVDFVAPTGSEMLDIAKTLHAQQNSSFKSGVRLENGDVSLAYEKTTVGKAGERGDLEIPSVFQIQVPILEGEPARMVDIRLRYELLEGKLSFSFEIIRRTALLEEVRRSIYATIANETKITPYLVA